MIVETGAAQNVERFENHFARVDAAQPVQQFFVERLHAHGNAVHAEVAEQFRLVGRNGGGIAFHGEFLRAEQVQSFHRAQDLFPLAQVQQRRRAAAEENGSRLEIARRRFPVRGRARRRSG